MALVSCRPDAGHVDAELIAGGLAEAGEPLLVAALADLGLAPATVAWDDPAVDWAAFDLAVIRSTWDYYVRLGEFVGWTKRAAEATALHNPLDVVTANVDKRYLLDLSDRGIPVVPTVVAERGDPSWVEVLDRSWGRVVVKPTVGAGASGFSSHESSDDGLAAAVADLHAAGHDALVQPRLESISTAGEVSIVVIDGHVGHAVRKVPAAGDDRVQPQHGGRVTLHEPSADEMAVVDALRPIIEGLLYARVDLVEVAGAPAVMELELVEPSLFLTHRPATAVGLAEAIARRVDDH